MQVLTIVVEISLFKILKYSVIKKDGLNFVSLYFKIRTSDKYDMAWTANGASTHARQLVAVFQVLCSLYELTGVGYAQNSLEFVSRSPLIHVVGRSFSLYTDRLFAQIGDSNDKCSSPLEVERWNEDETHAAQQSPNQCLWTHKRKILCRIVAILISTDHV